MHPTVKSTVPDPKGIKSIELPHSRLRRYARHLLDSYPVQSPPSEPSDPIVVVCISDTHNTTPDLPPGDLLLHAGDLTEHGSFEELQAQLNWLSSQPHTHKVVIAGNHDVLLDRAFLENHPRCNPERSGRTAADLDWRDVTYLCDEAVTLGFEKPGGARSLKIYGSPTTPQYGTSAFQVARDRDPWCGKVPRDTDVLLTHGPPWGHLDGALRSGCLYLGREIARVRSRLVVFGHIHVGFGQEDVVYHGVRRGYEDIVAGWAGWLTLVWIALLLAWSWIVQVITPGFLRRKVRRTRLVNAAVVGGEAYKYKNAPVVVKL